MRLRAALVATIVAIAAVAGTAPASGQVSSQVIVSVPGNLLLGPYAPPVVFSEPGGEMTFINADVARHDVVSYESGPDQQPWCEGYKADECPLFWTPQIGGLGTQVAVSGLENLQTGEIYTYYCTLHPWMEGTLIAL